MSRHEPSHMACGNDGEATCPPSALNPVPDDSLDKYLPRALQEYGYLARQANLPSTAPGQTSLPGNPTGMTQGGMAAGSAAAGIANMTVGTSEWIASLTPEQQHDLHQSGLLELPPSSLRLAGGAPGSSARGGERQGMSDAQGNGVQGQGQQGEAVPGHTAEGAAGAHERSVAPTEPPTSAARRGEWSGQGLRRTRSRGQGEEDTSAARHAVAPIVGRTGMEAPQRRRLGSSPIEERTHWDSRHPALPETLPPGTSHYTVEAMHQVPALAQGGAGPQQAGANPMQGTSNVTDAARATAEYLARLGSGGSRGAVIPTSTPGPPVGVPRAPSGVPPPPHPRARAIVAAGSAVWSEGRSEPAGDTLSDRGASSPPMDGIPLGVREFE